MAVAHAAHGGVVWIEFGILRLQLAYFFEKALLQHGVEALFDIMVQPFTLRRNQGDAAQGEHWRGAGLFGEVLAERPAGEQPHFQCAFDALAVAGLEAVGGSGVGLLQLGIEVQQAVLLFLLLQLAADLRIGGRQAVEAIDEGVVIHHGAAHNQRQAAARVDFAAQAQAVIQKIGHAVALRRVDDVDEVVRYGSALGRSGLSGADVHAAVNQRGIEADDFQRQLFGQSKRERGFTGGGGAEQGECRWRSGLRHEAT